jgi:hypothetical protein
VTSVTPILDERFTPLNSEVAREVPMDMLRQASLFARLTLIVDFVPLVMALVYVVRPTSSTWR